MNAEIVEKHNPTNNIPDLGLNSIELLFAVQLLLDSLKNYCFQMRKTS